jgi:hypothetical protein
MSSSRNTASGKSRNKCRLQMEKGTLRGVKASYRGANAQQISKLLHQASRKQWMKGHIAYFWIRKVSCRCRTLYLGRAHSSNRGITASGRFWGGVDCGGRSTKRARVVEPMNTRRAVTAWGSVENGTCRRAHGTNGKGVRTCTAVSNAVRIPRCGRFVDCCGLWE